MFEAKLQEGMILKKIVEAIKDLVDDVNIDLSPTGKCAITFKASLSKPWTTLTSRWFPSI
jgi:hypothetical protein